MASKHARNNGKLAVPLAVTVALSAFVTAFATGAIVIKQLGGYVPDKAADARSTAWIFAALLAVMAALVAGAVAFAQANGIGQRIAALRKAVGKLGRGGGDVRIRSSGHDEVGALGHALHDLAGDLDEMHKEQQKNSGRAATQDPQVRAYRDKLLPQKLPSLDGYEVDSGLSAGSRGGLDYFGFAVAEGAGVLWHVAGDGAGPLAVVAARLCCESIDRALKQGDTARKVLLATNKAMKAALPAGACAKATLLQLETGVARLWQAGARSPLLICQRGEVLELAAEGIALGLDDGPVFEKALRPQEVPMSPGTRLVLLNEAGHRAEGLLDLLRQHSPRHTAMFMNMVLGQLEQDAGEDGLREDLLLLTAKKAGQG